MNTTDILCGPFARGKPRCKVEADTKRDIARLVMKNDRMVANIVVTRPVNASPEKVFALVTAAEA